MITEDLNLRSILSELFILFCFFFFYFEKLIRTFDTFSFNLSCSVKYTYFKGQVRKSYSNIVKEKKNQEFPVCFPGNFSFIVVKCFDFKLLR